MLTLFTAKVYSFDDSTKTKQKNIELVKTVNRQTTDSTIVNKNNKKDVFVDNDDDGICDKRVKGMSFEKLRKRHRGNSNINNGRGYRRGKK